MNQEKWLLISWKNYIEKIDLEFKNSKLRRKWKWKVNGFETRTIQTKVGKLSFRITKYRKRQNGKWVYCYYEQEFLKLNKRKQFAFDLEKEAFKLFVNGLSLSKIKNYLELKRISRQTILNMINNYSNKQNRETNNYQQLSKSRKHLYIDIDDCYLMTKNKKTSSKKRFRKITMHLGFSKENKIIGKTIFLEIRNKKDPDYKTPYQWAYFLKAKIYEIYGYHLKIWILGDGASWIKQIARFLKANYILDSFHLKQKAFKALGYCLNLNRHNKKIFENIENDLQLNLYKTYLWYVKQLKFSSGRAFLEKVMGMYGEQLTMAKIKEIKQLINYVSRNVSQKENYLTKNGYIGTHTETWVSHHVKKEIKRKFTIFSIVQIKNILNYYASNNLSYIFV